MWRFFNLEWGRFSPFFLSIHPLFRFNFFLLISSRNIVLPDEIQKQGLRERLLYGEPGKMRGKAVAWDGTDQ
jgi:hypothetical protein